MTLGKIISRSPRELLFRARQEAGNVLLAAFPPSVHASAASPLPGLPDPIPILDTLRGHCEAEGLLGLARRLMSHRFPLLGMELNTGPAIDWRRDYACGRSSGIEYLRRIPYLDFARVGDHKVVWELNRHQHLIVLAQAFRLTGERGFLDELDEQLRSWLRQNPYQRGMNWASALEVAFRALSWIWVYHLVGTELPGDLRSAFLDSLYRHGRHLETNLSFYFAPNTHLLGEAVALHALGVLFPDFPRSRRWREYGSGTVRAQLERQVLPDGAHFERSPYYHVYALDFFLLHYLLADRPPDFRPVLERMAAWLDAVVGSSRSLPLIGDDDGGRLFHPYGDRTAFGCATLATCAALFGRPEWLRGRDDLFEQAMWWLGPQALELAPAAAPRTSALFPQSGFAVMTAGTVQTVLSAGAWASGTAGHSHSDSLSLVLRSGCGEILIDPGAYTYTGDSHARELFRGAAAHNTIRIDENNQAEAAGPFRWNAKPSVEVLDWRSGPAHDYLDARCSYRGFVHRRSVLFLKPGLLLLLDRIAGPEGSHTVEQFWHAAVPVCPLSDRCFSLGNRATLALAGAGVVEDHWRSRAYGSRERSQAVVQRCRAPLPTALAAAALVTDSGLELSLSLRATSAGLALDFAGVRSGSVLFPESGPPQLNCSS